MRNGKPSGLTRKTSQLLIRHPKLLDEASRRRLGELLERHVVLRTVIEFRDRLQQIWDETSAGHDSALARWDTFSRAFGNIHALREFAMRLPAYATTAGTV